MNKKNIGLAMNLMMFGTASVLPISHGDQRKIRKNLYLKYENGLINVVQLTESGLSLSEVLDRDIQILDQHKDALQYKIKKNKSGFARNFTGGIVLGGINAISANIAHAQAKYMSSLWNGDGSFSLKALDSAVGIASWFGAINEMQKDQYNREKAKQLFNDHPELGPKVAVFAGAGIVAIVSGLWCIQKVYNMCKFNHFSVSWYIAKCKRRIDRDEAIIAQLRQLKYDATVSQ